MKCISCGGTPESARWFGFTGSWTLDECGYRWCPPCWQHWPGMFNVKRPVGGKPV